ncbi:fungal-specific transcription factor domain-containing protein [Tricladium varicosporioides]|nr:fungal-specific transcription factor domain-containing protein [Hymenoscyphus varicosporioides]
MQRKCRKKKCDEILPKCSDCKRLNLPCVRPRAQPQQAPSIPQKKSPNFVHSPSPAPSYSTNDDTFSYRVGSPQDHQTPSEELLPWRRKQSNSELGSIQEGKSPSQNTEDDFAESASILYQISRPPNLSFDPLSIPAPFDITDIKDQHLLRHFIRTVSRSLSVVHQDTSNPFLRLIVPLAGSSKVVMESLLALSAAHLRGVYPEILRKGLSHQNKALKSLNEIISSRTLESSEETLATVLLLCMIEICDGNSTKWSWHISAAQTIIRAKLKTEYATTTWKFLLAMFGYVDSVITISKCKAPLITLGELSGEGGSPNDQCEPVSSSSMALYRSHNEALFGVAQPLFEIIGKISTLANRRKERVDKESEFRFRQSAKEIEEPLRAWTPDPIVSATSIHARDVINAAYAIKWASILRLHQVVEGYHLSHPEVIECTSEILSHIQKIRYGSSVECILIFPLVMAAAGSRDDEQRVMVKERWMVMERTIGFENIRRAREMVEAVWKAVDDGRENGNDNWGMSVNWARIRYFDFPGVVLL